MFVNGPISPKQCYYEIDYSFYSFYWLNSLEIRLDHNSTYYRSLSKNSDVKHRISHCDSQNLQYKTHPEFWPSHRRIFKTSLYYKTRLILETRRYVFVSVRTPPATDSCSQDNFWDFFHFWHDYWPWPIDYLIRFWSIFVMTLTFSCQGQIWNLLYLSQKWSDCHETKSKHIDWTLGLKRNQRD